jgi:hypothetical protein
MMPQPVRGAIRPSKWEGSKNKHKWSRQNDNTMQAHTKDREFKPNSTLYKTKSCVVTQVFTLCYHACNVPQLAWTHTKEGGKWKPEMSKFIVFDLLLVTQSQWKSTAGSE